MTLAKQVVMVWVTFVSALVRWVILLVYDYQGWFSRLIERESNTKNLDHRTLISRFEDWLIAPIVRVRRQEHARDQRLSMHDMEFGPGVYPSDKKEVSH